MKKEYLSILIGHLLFILSGIFYSVFWVMQEYSADSFSTFFLYGSVLSGLVAIVLIAYCIQSLSLATSGRKFKVTYIFVFGFIFFLIALAVTGIGFARVFTSELFLIVLWASVEFSAIFAIARGKWLSAFKTISSIILISISLAIGLVCYTLHYSFQGVVRFYNGLIPYLTISAAMFIIGLLILFSYTKIKKSGD